MGQPGREVCENSGYSGLCLGQGSGTTAEEGTKLKSGKVCEAMRGCMYLGGEERERRVQDRGLGNTNIQGTGQEGSLRGACHRAAKRSEEN